MILEAQTRCPSSPLTVTCLRQPNHTYINSKVIKPVITSRQTEHHLKGLRPQQNALRCYMSQCLFPSSVCLLPSQSWRLLPCLASTNCCS